MRRRWLLAPLVFAVGCRATADQVPHLIERQIFAVAPTRVEYAVTPCAATEMPLTPSDLAGLWQLALTHNPALREAAAEVEIARGRLGQAEKFPNPKIVYHGDQIGTQEHPKGTQGFEVLQEVVTAGKRRLDVEAAGRGLDAATMALLGRKLDALTRIRRAYYDYQALAASLQVNRQVVADLERYLTKVRERVEKVGDFSRSDLLRAEALQEQARITLTRGQVNLDAAWKQVAAEVGVPALPPPPTLPILTAKVAVWPADVVTGRVLSANTDLSQAALETEKARLEYERARAEAVPNVAVGAGYSRSFVESTAGASITLETTLPLWDRKQGLIHEKRARWAQAQAAERTTEARLSRETAEAFARYEGARVQTERFENIVLRKLVESLQVMQKNLELGVTKVTFVEVQLVVEALNDARVRHAEARRELWRAVADLEGLMQLDLNEQMNN